MKVSIIMPVERLGGDAERAIASVLQQEAPFPFELITVTAQPLEPPAATGVRNVVEPNRNPATRRNRAASVASGEYLAFLDDDAVADPHWLASACAYLDSHTDVLALGGPDPAPPDSPAAELVSDTLLAAPWIGSGIAAHENRAGVFTVQRASDIALVNLFVRRSAFEGFDEGIGYIGEDTALIERLIARGRVVYHSGVLVHHRRRPFPAEYLRQRWRYRVKTGETLARGGRTNRDKIIVFLIAGFLGISFAPLLIVPYYVATLVLGASVTRLPKSWWPMLPFAFAAHHVTYFAGIIWGWIRARFLH